jgi:hypothetical protein
MLKITICPTCESANIKKVRRNCNGQAKGHSYTVPNLEYYDARTVAKRFMIAKPCAGIQEFSPAFSAKLLKKVS